MVHLRIHGRRIPGRSNLRVDLNLSKDEEHVSVVIAAETTVFTSHVFQSVIGDLMDLNPVTDCCFYKTCSNTSRYLLPLKLEKTAVRFPQLLIYQFLGGELM